MSRPASGLVTTFGSSSVQGIPGAGDSGNPSLSRDGRWLAFESVAQDLAPSATPGHSGIYIKDLYSGAVARVDTTQEGVPANGASVAPSLSADGRHIAFWSDADNLVPGDTNGASDVFVKDLTTGVLLRASVSTFGQQADGPSYDPSLSADGTLVAFTSDATNLVSEDTNGASDVFVKDLETGFLLRASVSDDDEQGDQGSGWPRLTPDGRYLAFESLARNLVGFDTNLESDVFVRDLVAGTLRRASEGPDGADADGPSLMPSISDDGQTVTFLSEAPSLSGIGSPLRALYSRRMDTGEIRRLSGIAAGLADRPVLYGGASGSGRIAAAQELRAATRATTGFGTTVVAFGLPGAPSIEVFGDAPEGQGPGMGLRPAFTGDGRLLAYQAYTGWGSPQEGWQVFLRLLKQPTRGDFDGDGRSDLLLRHSQTGENALWLINGTSVASAALITPAPDPAWQLVGMGDFTGDGRSDLFWRHAVTGENVLWGMSGFALVGPGVTLPAPDPSWRVAGIADFNGDGISDVLWRHAQTGQDAIWLMHGTQVVAAGELPAVPDMGWFVAGVGDFDGDGRADILWRHTLTGENAIWLMDGTRVAEGRPIVPVQDLAWRVAGVADFGGTGRAAILWRHGVTGENGLWAMDGFTLLGAGFLPPAPDPAWSVVGLGDYNGDGKADVLWRHFVTGMNAIWLMDGLQLIAGDVLPSVPDLGWTPLGP
ncbi:MAG TPA: FG-GAP-like repeat-containing protein [Armatimonadota bacterium]